jgi:Na+/melibiose symporter-like transporter
MLHAGLRYGALGAPLAFAALPLYVVLPSHYATQFGVSLAAIGALLLAARALDAAVDPWLGRLADRWLAHSRQRAWRAALAASLPLAAGFAALFLPPVRGEAGLLAWCAVALLLTYFGYSLLGVLHQAWGARLGGDAAMRARIVGWREGASLAGVLAASVLASAAGMPVLIMVFVATLATALLALAGAPFRHAAAAPRRTPGRPWANPPFRRLITLYLVNGIASAIPATLVLFFIRDRLQAQAWEPLFLALYFAAGAASMPLWVAVVRRLGLARAWLTGMGLAIASFAWAAALGPGDVVAYAAICAASGVALGADLSVPPALLTGAIQRAGDDARDEGAYFGWWNAATKLNLALAAGLALPALQAWGYRPGSADAQGLAALALAYCALPCVLKLAAAIGLWHWHRRGDIE